MPRRNRVTPDGTLIDAGRGTFMGNRGCLHDGAGEPQRTHRGRRWIVCVLEVGGRRLPLDGPGLNTQLFFLDEATALAAGHRPCRACRRDAFHAFVDAWRAGNSGILPHTAGIDAIDRMLHAERVGLRERAPLDALPDGTLVVLGGDPAAYLVLEHGLRAWGPHGYAAPLPRPAAVVEVLTPFSIVRALRAGYRPVLHASVVAPTQDAGGG